MKELHVAHVLGRDSEVAIDISQLAGGANLPDFMGEKLFARCLEDGLIWWIALTYNPERIRNYGFVGRIDGPNAYPLLKQAHERASRSTLRLLVNANSGIDTDYQNFTRVFQNITPHYSGFYPNHPSQHYLQIGDYPAPQLAPVIPTHKQKPEDGTIANEFAEA